MTPPPSQSQRSRRRPSPRNAASTPALDAGVAASALSLPTDAIFDILSWTPIKSLCRFRCVSREWRALIANPAFLAAHKSRAGPQRLLVAHYFHENPTKVSGLRLLDLDGNVVRVIKDDVGALRQNPHDHLVFPPGYLSFDLHMIDVATGEVLLTGRKLYERSRNIDREMYIWAHYALGFGRAVLSGALKVIRVIEPLGEYVDGRSLQAYEVLELGDPGSGWRLAPSAPNRVLTTLSDSFAVMIDGVAHFLADHKYNVYPDNVVCFDLESEQWKKTIRGPLRDDWENLNGIRLAELDGALCMVGEQRRHSCTYVWVLTDYANDIWVRAYTIPMERYVMPLTVTPDGGKLHFCLLGRRPVLQVYDPRASTCIKAMEIAGDIIGELGLCRLQLEHFVSPNISGRYIRILLCLKNFLLV